jgi:hypothetical protein
MATAAPIAANRANAAHSTGPRTEEGQSRTRGNASRHGLWASAAVMSEEEKSVFNLLLAEYPLATTQGILGFKMATTFFSFAACGKRRLLAARFQPRGTRFQTGRPPMRYQGIADRHIDRNLNDLRKMQKERRWPACSQKPLLILPPRTARRHHLSFRRAQRDATSYPSNQPPAMVRYRPTAACDGKIPANSRLRW